jgi:hypothetical protein
VLVLSREIDHLIDLRRGDLAHVRPAHPHPLAMHLQHHLRGLFPAHREKQSATRQQQSPSACSRRSAITPYKAAAASAGFLGLEKAAVLLLVGHFPLVVDWR